MNKKVLYKDRTKGLCDRAVLRNTPNVARRVVTAAAQRDTAGNDDDLWLCADGCTHHSDHLSIFLRAVLLHRPQKTILYGYKCLYF